MKKVMSSKRVNRDQLKIELMDYLLDSNEGEIGGESVRFVYDQIVDAAKQGFSFDQLRSWALDEGITLVEALDLYNKNEDTDIVESSTKVYCALESNIKKALDKAKSDARKALKIWHNNGDLEFDRILEDMGYAYRRSSMYSYYKPISSYSADGFNTVFAIIDFYELIVKNDHFVTVCVSDRSNDGENLTGDKIIKDTWG